jgi:hypothetical protein
MVRIVIMKGGKKDQIMMLKKVVNILLISIIIKLHICCQSPFLYQPDRTLKIIYAKKELSRKNNANCQDQIK